jgi:hypothetical protein
MKPTPTAKDSRGPVFKWMGGVPTKYTLAADATDGKPYDFTGPAISLTVEGTADPATTQMAYQIDDGPMNPIIDIQTSSAESLDYWCITLTETDCPEPGMNYLLTVYQWTPDGSGGDLLSIQVLSFFRGS